MDRDIVVLTDGYLQEFFSDRVSTQDMSDIKDWLCTQIQTERQGWKSRLQTSMKEIERERKLSMDIQSSLQLVHSRLAQFVKNHGTLLRREASFHGSDKDIRASMATQVHEHTNQLLGLLAQYIEERGKCFDLLNLTDYQHMHLYDAIKGHMEHLRERLAEYENEADKVAARLQSEIDNLQQKITQQTLSNLRERDMQYQELKRVRDQLNSVSSDRSEISLRFDKEVQVEAWSLVSTVSSSVQTEPVTQKNESVLTEPSDPELYPYPVTSVSMFSVNELKQKQNNRGRNTPHPSRESDDAPKSPRGLKVTGIANVTSNRGEMIKELHRNVTSRAEDQLQNLSSQNSDQRGDLDNLRSQVVTFAERLEKAKIDMEHYQRQLASIKMSKPSPFFPFHKQDGPLWASFPSDKNGYGNVSARDGYLGGIRKEVHQHKEKNIVAALHAKNKKAGETVKNSATATCLRCHKVYRIKDNHRLACRYHPKSKQRLEKYDSNGKLMRVAFLWECCLQKAEAVGCSTGEHM